jgi:hypothetical protein
MWTTASSRCTNRSFATICMHCTSPTLHTPATASYSKVQRLQATGTVSPHLAIFHSLLLEFASVNHHITITMEGYLNKRGRGKSFSFIRPWTKRFFVLDTATESLYYYTSDEPEPVRYDPNIATNVIPDIPLCSAVPVHYVNLCYTYHHRLLDHTKFFV